MKNVTMADKSAHRPRSLNLDVIRRLAMYLRTLKGLKTRGVIVTSSDEIVQPLGFSSAQFRKDISHFGKLGRSGVGYSVDLLIAGIRRILCTDKPWNVAVVGVGDLGQSLLYYGGFADFNFNICAAFDNSPAKIGKIFNGIKVEPDTEFERIFREKDIKVAILAVDNAAAQEVSVRLRSAGIKALLNYTPVSLSLPHDVRVASIDVACELEILVCRVSNADGKRKLKLPGNAKVSGNGARRRRRAREL